MSQTPLINIPTHARTHSDVFTAHFLNVFAMVYGDLGSALNAARHVHRVHTNIQGPISETLGEYTQGDLYRANEPEALLWVHATLWESSVRVFELLVRPLSATEKEQYYQETKRFAHLFGIDGTVLPATWADFQRYNEDMWQKLVVGSAAREIGSFLFQPLFFGSGPVLRWLEIMTAGLMPENLRIGFGIPFGRGRQRIYRASIYALRITHRFWPKRLRFVPPYVEGLRRVSGQKKRDRVGEWLMKLWLGPLRT